MGPRLATSFLFINKLDRLFHSTTRSTGHSLIINDNHVCIGWNIPSMQLTSKAFVLVYGHTHFRPKENISFRSRPLNNVLKFMPCRNPSFI
ncbi:hypothetical protein K474DRAFT_558355 [Panus rudis PR-1116 ss-1]|nr:hypothetical protein K474DRAFT_558355 [Panus rudis PR-1116 ss-1]